MNNITLDELEFKGIHLHKLAPGAELEKIKVYETHQLKIYGVYSDGMRRDPLESSGNGITYSSNDEKVVSVSQKGLIEARDFGSAQVTVNHGNFWKTVIVTVDPEESDIKGRVRLQLIRLKDADPKTRLRAANSLGRLKSRDAVSELIQAFGDEDSQVRSAAAFAVSKINDQKSVPVLIAILNGQNVMKKIAAAHALGGMEEKSAVDPLIKNLKDRELAYDTALALAWIGDPKAIEPLSRLFNNKEMWAKNAATHALIEMLKEKPGNTVSREASLKALTKLTGQKFTDYTQWGQWWDKEWLKDRYREKK
jgi:hypothetical protein